MKKRREPRSRAEQIHYTMSRIRGKDTKIEVALRRALWHNGIRYRKNFAALPGKPDIAITKYKIAVFCDGEFWHGKDWGSQKSRLHSNRDFWVSKIERTIARDNKTDSQLESRGWYVLRFWGREIKENLEACVRAVEEAVVRAQIDSSGSDVLYPPGDIDGEEGYAAAEREPEYCPPDLEGMVHTPELAPVSPSVCVKRFVSESDRGMNHAIKSNSLPNEDTSELAPRFFIK